MNPLVAVSDEPLDIDTLTAAVCRDADAFGEAGASGAVTSFVGLVRSEHRGRQVLRLEYEAYVPLAVRALERIRHEAASHWPGATLGIHHRIGAVAVGQASVMIVAASPHRADAFAACRFAIERVRQVVPIWKREFFHDGSEWLEGATADPEDEAALAEALKRSCR